MKIYIIGAGNIGKTLGAKWAAQGHKVVFGVRDPAAQKIQTLLAEVGHGTSAVPSSAVPQNADIVLFAVPARVMADLIPQIGSKLNGKILIDATNNVGASPMHQLDMLRQHAPDSALFRAFSNLGWENFADPIIGGQQVDLFYCGDGGQAQQTVHDLIIDIGLHPVYIGGADQAAVIDGMTRLWFALVMGQGYGRHTAFKLLSE